MTIANRVQEQGYYKVFFIEVMVIVLWQRVFVDQTQEKTENITQVHNKQTR